MRQQKANLYEGMYILNPMLSEDARQKALERIKSGIISRGGEVVKLIEQGRKKLAYQIDGKREGYFLLLYFEAPTNQMQDIWREYHLNEDLIRFLTLRAEQVPDKIEFPKLPDMN